MAPVILELFGIGKEIRLTVTGGSMYPFLRGGRDSVILQSAGMRRLRRGDIVLFVRPNGQYVLHRIIRARKAGLYLLGDAQTVSEGPVDPKSVVAVVRSVCRGGREIETRGLLWRAASASWMLLWPARKLLLRLAPKIARLRQV